MKYHELKVQSSKKPQRVGRGISAGQGKTAGRGTKGQKSRTGSSAKPGFEGGTNPLIQKLPKLPGFKSHRPLVYEVKTSQINNLSVKNVDNAALVNANLVDNEFLKVKVILNGEITKAVDVKLQSASAGAIKAIEKAGGKFTKVEQVKRVKKVTSKPAK